MRLRSGIAFVLFAWLSLGMSAGLPTPAHAVQPDEVLADPALEARAREISAGLRCPVCRNENIDESSAPVSKDLRLIVRERLVAGDTDAEVVDFVVARFGEFVLLRPEATGSNVLLWLAAPGLLLVALGIGWTTVRRRAQSVEAPLSEDEKARLHAILKE